MAASSVWTLALSGKRKGVKSEELDRWEAEAKNDICGEHTMFPCPDNKPGCLVLHGKFCPDEKSKRITALIEEVRRLQSENESLKKVCFANQNAALNLCNRVESAEQALKTYAANVWDDATSLGDYDDNGYGKCARAHFEKYGKKEVK